MILSGGQYYGGGFSNFPASDAAQDYVPVGSADAGTDAGYESAEQVRADDVAALFAGLTGSTARVTRMRSDIAQAAMTTDFVLQASTDQSELSNVRNVTQSVNLTCPVYNGCNVVGTGTPGQAQASVDGGGTPGGSGSGGSSSGSGGAAGASGGSASSGGTLGGSGSGGVTPIKASSGGGSSSGCAASAQGTPGGVAAFGALAGMLGLVIGRMIRVRRRARSKG